ncbi:MAG: methylated-DNA--[protein]-cysteine S-methyltransferase [Clostridiales bacterium]
MRNIYYYKTSIGNVCFEDNGKAITNAYLLKNEIINEEFLNESDLIKKAKKELDEYLEGTRKDFDIKLEPEGTEFQRNVWNALIKIPYGKTASYSEIANIIKNPKAVRAVGGANNKNPIFIFIPCHRVIGIDGSMIGYAGGIKLKKHLLNIEKNNTNS